MKTRSPRVTSGRSGAGALAMDAWSSAFASAIVLWADRMACLLASPRRISATVFSIGLGCTNSLGKDGSMFANEDAYFNLGSLYGRLGRYADAEQTFETALKHFSATPEVLYYLGLACEKQEKKDHIQLAS